MNKTTLIIPVVVILIAAVLSSVFIVDEREKALVLRFGRVVQTVEEPGLAFRMPLMDQVVTYDDRIISIDMEAQEIIPNDDRRLKVDAFARYRIINVELFRQATGAGGDQAIAVADNRLETILNAETRAVLGSVSSGDILSTDRDALMLRIRNGAASEARSLGLEVIDVRLKRTKMNVPVVVRPRSGSRRWRIVRLLNLNPKRAAKPKSYKVKQTPSETRFLRMLTVRIRNSSSSIVRLKLTAKACLQVTRVWSCSRQKASLTTCAPQMALLPNNGHRRFGPWAGRPVASPVWSQ